MIYLIFIVILIFILFFIYLYDLYFVEKFNNIYLNNNLQSYEPVDYNIRKQDCNELTYNPKNCVVETVIPKNKKVCNNSLTPISNNDIDIKKNKKSKKNPSTSLQYDFDLLSSFNNSQLNNLNNNVHIDTKTDIRSLNSIENDLISNY